MRYDYIIAGAGCAGLSLLMRLLQQPQLNKKSILVIDQSQKEENDRTWCFWEKSTGPFESIVHHSWKEVNFYSDSFSSKLDLYPYQYKMVRGIDFYNYVIAFAKQFPNVEFRYEKVTAVHTAMNMAIAELGNDRVEGNYIFSSIIFEKPELEKNEYYLFQHFKGWVIETKQPSFNPSVATFMDFRVSQEHGTTFMYVMPTSATKALVEYALFTETLLQQNEYETALKDYITQKLGIQDYCIEHEEFGIIPMTNHPFPLQQGKVIYIGIAGGQVKGSSGYAFQFIQKRIKGIIDSLVKHDHPFIQQTLTNKKFHFYDSVLLQILQHHKMNGDSIFAAIFKGNEPKTVLKFLDNESNLLEDLKIMSTVPSSIFLPAAFKEMFR